MLVFVFVFMFDSSKKAIFKGVQEFSIMQNTMWIWKLVCFYVTRFDMINGNWIKRISFRILPCINRFANKPMISHLMSYTFAMRLLQFENNMIIFVFKSWNAAFLWDLKAAEEKIDVWKDGIHLSFPLNPLISDCGRGDDYNIKSTKWIKRDENVIYIFRMLASRITRKKKHLCIQHSTFAIYFDLTRKQK